VTVAEKAQPGATGSRNPARPAVLRALRMAPRAVWRALIAFIVSSGAKHLAGAAVIGVVLIEVSDRLTPFRDFQMAQVAPYAIAVAGLTMLIGLSGQISIGNGAFMFLGGYTTALLMAHTHWPLALLLVASALSGAVVGGLVGVAAARLRGPYLAGATLLLALALPSITSQWQSVFLGDQGLPVTISTPNAFLTNPYRWLAWIGVFCAIAAFVPLANLGRSRIGRSWRAIRDDEVAAALSGVNVARYRVLAFVLSAAVGGLGGALYVMVTNVASPGAFTLSLSITLLVAALIGGLGSLAGAIWGSLVIVLVPNYLTDVLTSHGISSQAAANSTLVGYGVVLIIVMLVFPHGIQGGIRRFLWPAAPGAAGSFSVLRRLQPATRVLRRHRPASPHQEEGTR
jgi:branched-chain amino acid transport system permease protein